MIMKKHMCLNNIFSQYFLKLLFHGQGISEANRDIRPKAALYWGNQYTDFLLYGWCTSQIHYPQVMCKLLLNSVLIEEFWQFLDFIASLTQEQKLNIC